MRMSRWPDVVPSGFGDEFNYAVGKCGSGNCTAWSVVHRNGHPRVRVVRAPVRLYIFLSVLHLVAQCGFMAGPLGHQYVHVSLVRCGFGLTRGRL